MTISRRRALAAISALAVAAFVPMARAAVPTIYRNAGCGCCHKWAEHMRAEGIAVEMADVDDLLAVHEKLGVPEPLRGCHAGIIEGYVIEGHVPAKDIARLLQTRPDAKGLSVPGMPVGSPGMEMGGDSDAYDVLLFKADGTSSVFASYR